MSRAKKLLESTTTETNPASVGDDSALKKAQYRVYQVIKRKNTSKDDVAAAYQKLIDDILAKTRYVPANLIALMKAELQGETPEGDYGEDAPDDATEVDTDDTGDADGSPETSYDKVVDKLLSRIERKPAQTKAELYNELVGYLFDSLSQNSTLKTRTLALIKTFTKDNF